MFFKSPKGIIALDIDGTVTAHAHELDSKVIDALSEWAEQGWIFIFITGRPFQWGITTLKTLPFSYALAVQNGALLLEMPERKILMRKYLNQNILPQIERISLKYETDFIVYSGLENEDWCYYRSANFSPEELAYGLKRAEFLGEKWRFLSDFTDLPISQFSSIKFFTQDDKAYLLSQTIEEEMGLHAPPNRDPFNSNYFVIQVTHADATKGNILKEFIREKKINGPIIVAGDDHNDRSMLEIANVKIVMENAPAELLAMADVIAPSALQLGIIQGLTEAVSRLNLQRG